MEKIEIRTGKNEVYDTLETIYAGSFPVYEQRTAEQQAAAFTASEYHVVGYLEQGRLVGFIAYWAFETYLYIEHFAIHPSLRGGGYGSLILNRFVAETTKVVLLEIDPVQDDVSAARLRFYRKCGFFQNGYPHIHPPYRVGYAGHRLEVLSSGRTISREEYDRFAEDLTQTVMKN